jgi:hypothetical protein
VLIVTAILFNLPTILVNIPRSEQKANLIALRNRFYYLATISDLPGLEQLMQPPQQQNAALQGSFVGGNWVPALRAPSVHRNTVGRHIVRATSNSVGVQAAPVAWEPGVHDSADRTADG